MKQIQPYFHLNEALSSLDNGGHFYNLFSNAEDGKISQAELAKVGGVFNERQQLILFLELSISGLGADAKEELLSKFDEGLMASYQKYKAQELVPSEALNKGIIAGNAIITGIPIMVDSRSDFKGFVIVPIMAGKVMTLIPVPIIDTYDVYEVRDEISSQTFFIAHAKGSEKLPAEKIKVAGVLKEFKAYEEEENASGKFLEVNYYLSWRLSL